MAAVTPAEPEVCTAAVDFMVAQVATAAGIAEDTRAAATLVADLTPARAPTRAAIMEARTVLLLCTRGLGRAAAAPATLPPDGISFLPETMATWAAPEPQATPRDPRLLQLASGRRPR